jgi:5'-nucleotidase
MTRPDWSRVSTVLLDMDGTLLDLRYDNAFWFDALPAHLARCYGMSTPAARALVDAHARRLLGTLEFYCLDHWSTLLGLDVAAANEELADLIALRPAVAEFLAWLRREGLHTMLTTNSHPRGLAFKLARTGLGAWLDEVISAHTIGAPKEDPRFWAALRGRGIALERALLVDDNAAVLRCARACGVGQVVGVLTPDSGLPAQYLDGFSAVRHMRELWADAMLS